MDTKLLTDFESAAGAIADVYFLAGFIAGFVVCVLVVSVVVSLNR